MQNRYILLTAAKNEEAYIGEAIAAVLRQTVRPAMWLIIDDCSTDGTARKVEEFAAENSFIRLYSAGQGSARNFGSKDRALQTAYNLVRQLDFEFVGIYDADITHERSDYYEVMLGKLRNNPRLGIVGGYIHERTSGVWRPRKGNSKDSVAGGIQLFRRNCFEAIGGFKPLTLGGSDWLAELEATMGGWEVLACPDFPVRHYRPTSSANGRLRGWFQMGLRDASFGSHPLFEMLKCARRLTASPFAVGAAMRLSGYLWWTCRGREPVIPLEKVAFLRKQQMAKIGALSPFLKQGLARQ